jgi:hypothetical protein
VLTNFRRSAFRCEMEVIFWRMEARRKIFIACRMDHSVSQSPFISSRASSQDAESLANVSPLPIHGCAPTARTGRRRKRLVFQRWTVPGTARNDAIAHQESALASRPSISANVQNLEPGTWNLELGTWNLELGTWNLELGTYRAGGATSRIKAPFSPLRTRIDRR